MRKNTDASSIRGIIVNPTPPTDGQVLKYSSANGDLEYGTGGGGGGSTWGSITGTLSAQTDLQNALNAKDNNAVASVDIYIDGNRVDTYTADGTINRPFKTLSASLSSITKASTLHIAAGTYTEASLVTYPNFPLVVYGNGSTITYAAGVTIQNPNYTRYDLNTIGNVTFSSSSAGRVLVQGGSIVGNITLNGLTDFKSMSLLSGTITVNSTAQMLAIVCTFTSQITGNGIIIIEDNNINATKSTPMITSTTGGTLFCVGNIITNLGTGGAVSCDNYANGTTRVNAIVNNTITVASGTPIATGTSITIYSKNNIAGGTNTGAGFIPTTSDYIGAANMLLGSDATGDIYYRNVSGLLTRLGIGTNTQVLTSNGTIPGWATPSGGSFSWGATASGSSGVGLALTASSGSTGGIAIAIANSSTAPTTAWQTITLGNTQAVAHTLMTLDTGTSAQANKGLLIKCYNASTTSAGLTIDPSTTGTGSGLYFPNIGGNGFAGIVFNDVENYSGGGIIQKVIGATSNAIGINQLQIGSTSVDSGVSCGIKQTLTGFSATTYGVGIHQDLNCLYNIGFEQNAIGKYGIYQYAFNIGICWYANALNIPSAATYKYFSLNNIQSGVLSANRTTDTSEILFSRTNTGTTGTITDNFNIFNINWTAVQNGAGGTLTAAGSGINISLTGTQTAGALTDTRNGLSVTMNGVAGGNPISITQNVVTSTNFRKIMKETNSGVTLWVSNGTTPQGNLSGTLGDICFNGLSGHTFWCSTTGTTWTQI